MGKGKSGELIRWGSQDNMERIGRRSRIHGITKTLRSNAARRFPLRVLVAGVRFYLPQGTRAATSLVKSQELRLIHSGRGCMSCFDTDPHGRYSPSKISPSSTPALLYLSRLKSCATDTAEPPTP